MTEPKPRPFPALILGGFLALFAAACCGGTGGDQGPAIQIGAEVSIVDPTGGTVLVYADEASHRAAVKAAAAKDRVGFNEATRTSFEVAGGTRALVLEYVFPAAYKIRVRSGPHDGRAGFMPRELLKP